jgi:hypothetical protein
MQGQAPWTVNVGLMWDQDRWGTSFSILYNNLGERLIAVGNTENLNIYAETRGKLDLALSQRIGANLKAKFTIKDILAQDQVTNSGPNRDEFSRITVGTEYTLAASYNF